MCNFFGPNHKQLQDSTWQASWGTAALSTPDRCMTSALQSLEKVTGPSGYPWSLIFAFLAQTISPLVLFNWGLRPKSSSDASAEVLLWGLRRRRKLWRYFSPLWLSIQYFHIHSSSHLLSGPRFHKIVGVFCLGSLNSETMPTCVLIHLFLTGMPLHGGEKKRAVGAFLGGWLVSCFYYHISD